MARLLEAGTAGKDAGRPRALAVLVGAAVLVALVGAASLWGSGGVSLYQTQLHLSQTLGLGSIGTPSWNDYTVKKYVGDEEAVGNCTIPVLNITGLQEYGCRILNDSCFDQHRIIAFNPPDDFPFDNPFVNMGWTPTFVPGWTMLNKSGSGPIGTDIVQPQVRKNSTEDRPDLKDPIFSSCFTPLVWVAPWHISVAEFFLNSFVPLWNLQQKEHLVDRNIMLAPVLDGYNKPAFAENLLRPYTNKMILTFNDLSSRIHMIDPKFPRCYKKVAVCGLKGLYRDRPERKYTDKVLNISMYDGDKTWTWFQPAKAGRYLVDYYRAQGQMPPVLDPKEEGTLQIVVGNRTDGYRLFLNLTEFLADCNAWQPPAPYKRTRCLALSFNAKDFLDHVAVLQETDILVTHHGAELCNGFFLPWGASVVEVRPKGFAEDWAQVYYPSLYRTENEIYYWTARVERDDNWEPGYWERDRRPYHVYELERFSRLRWEQWQPIFTRVLSIKRSKAAYEKLKYPDDLRWII